MKSLKSMILAAFVVVALGAPMAAHADLAKLAQGAGAGSPQKDSVGGQSVQESYDKGLSWQLPISYSVLSGTSGAPLALSQVVGIASTYVGPWRVRIYNSGPTTVVATNLTGTAYNASFTAKGPNVAASTGFLEVGPISARDYVHLRGLTQTSTGEYQLGTYNR